MSTAGTIYDVNALGRTKETVRRQLSYFAETENEENRKQWIGIGAIVVIGVVVLMVVSKKLAR